MDLGEGTGSVDGRRSIVSGSEPFSPLAALAGAGASTAGNARNDGPGGSAVGNGGNSGYDDMNLSMEYGLGLDSLGGALHSRGSPGPGPSFNPPATFANPRKALASHRPRCRQLRKVARRREREKGSPVAVLAKGAEQGVKS